MKHVKIQAKILISSRLCLNQTEQNSIPLNRLKSLKYTEDFNLPSILRIDQQS